MFPHRRLAGTVAVAALLALGLAACDGAGEAEPDPAPTSAAPTPLDEIDTAALAVARADFCDAVPADATASALDEEVGEAASYDNGDVAEVAPGAEDRLHEIGCRWYGEGDPADLTTTRASAWVFAPPVTPEQAELYVGASVGAGCRAVEGQAAYGAPTLATVCRTAVPGTATTSEAEVTEVSFRGLFGDAWLTCTLRAPTVGEPAGAEPPTDDDLFERAGTWCGQVALAAAGDE